jgi:hypothetical protein
MNRTTTITKKTAMTIPAMPPLDVLDFFLEDLDFPRAREANCRRGRTRWRNDLLAIMNGLFLLAWMRLRWLLKQINVSS